MPPTKVFKIVVSHPERQFSERDITAVECDSRKKAIVSAMERKKVGIPKACRRCCDWVKGRWKEFLSK